MLSKEHGLRYGRRYAGRNLTVLIFPIVTVNTLIVVVSSGDASPAGRG